MTRDSTFAFASLSFRISREFACPRGEVPSLLSRRRRPCDALSLFHRSSEVVVHHPPTYTYLPFFPWNQTSCGGHVDSVSRWTCRRWHLTASPGTNGLRYHGDTLLSGPPPSPALTPFQVSLPSASLSHARENVFLLPPTEKRCLSVSRGEQGLEGGTIIYLLSLARPRTRVNHPRLCGYCFRRVVIPERYARELQPAVDEKTLKNYNPLFFCPVIFR